MGLNLGLSGPAEWERMRRELSVEALGWSRTLPDIFEIRDTIVSGDVDDNDVLTVFFEKCSKSLDTIQITNTLPEKVLTDRTDYRDMLMKRTEKYSQMEFNSVMETNIHVGSVVAGVVDYANGPIYAHYLAKHVSEEGQPAFGRVLGSYMHSTLEYGVSVENNKEGRRQRLGVRANLRPPRDKVIGRGRKESIPTSALVGTLNEFIEPMIYTVGKSDDEVESLRNKVEESMTSLAKARDVLRPEQKLRRVLLEDVKVRRSIVDSIRPTYFTDIVVGHPLVNKISDYVMSNSATKRRIQDLEALRMGVFAGRQCPQYATYDQLFDVTYGEEPSVWRMIGGFLVGFGYPPIGGLESYKAKALVANRGTAMNKILPELRAYVNKLQPADLSYIS